MPVSYAFLARAKAWWVLRSIVSRLSDEQRAAAAAAASFSGRHDQLEKQLDEAKAQQQAGNPAAASHVPAPPAPGTTASGTPAAGAPPPAPRALSTPTTEAITSNKRLASRLIRLRYDPWEAGSGLIGLSNSVHFQLRAQRSFHRPTVIKALRIAPPLPPQILDAVFRCLSDRETNVVQFDIGIAVVAADIEHEELHRVSPRSAGILLPRLRPVD